MLVRAQVWLLTPPRKKKGRKSPSPEENEGGPPEESRDQIQWKKFDLSFGLRFPTGRKRSIFGVIFDIYVSESK